MSYMKYKITKKIFVLIFILILFNFAAFLLLNNAPNKYLAKVIFEPSKFNQEYLQSPEEILAYLKTSNTFSKSNKFKFTQINSFILAEVQSESADKANSAIQYLLDDIENQAITSYNTQIIATNKENRKYKEFINIFDKLIFIIDTSDRKKLLSFLSEKKFRYISQERTKTKVILNQKLSIY